MSSACSHTMNALTHMLGVYIRSLFVLSSTKEMNIHYGLRTASDESYRLMFSFYVGAVYLHFRSQLCVHSKNLPVVMGPLSPGKFS